jgi:hypothetical protein
MSAPLINSQWRWKRKPLILLSYPGNLKSVSAQCPGEDHVKRITDKGYIYHEPPYTRAEEDEFYRRNAGGPVAVYRGKNFPRASQAQRSAQPTADNTEETSARPSVSQSESRD